MVAEPKQAENKIEINEVNEPEQKSAMNEEQKEELKGT